MGKLTRALLVGQAALAGASAVLILSGTNAGLRPVLVAWVAVGVCSVVALTRGRDVRA